MPLQTGECWPSVFCDGLMSIQSGTADPGSCFSLATDGDWRRLRRHRHEPSTRSVSASTAPHGFQPTPENVLGVLSLIVYALV